MKRFRVRMTVVEVYECEFEEESESALGFTIAMNGVPDNAETIDTTLDYEIIETEYI